MLNSCGTHFVDEFSTGKQAYLENVLVIQNEPGIQEVNLHFFALEFLKFLLIYLLNVL